MTGFRLGTAAKKDKLSPPANKPTALVDAVTGPPQGFGIKSYLHNFYYSPTPDDVEQTGAWYLLPPPPSQRRGLFVCRICTIIGLFLLLSGAVGIIIGYTWPQEPLEDSISHIAVFQDDEGNLYIPREKMEPFMRDPMRHWKTTGFLLFASGAIILALSLMVPMFAQCIGSKRLQGFISEENSPNEPPIRIYPGHGAPGSGPVPVMEEIAKPIGSEAQPRGDRLCVCEGLLTPYTIKLVVPGPFEYDRIDVCLVPGRVDSVPSTCIVP
ncbi:unnamed protein product, partial [Mesorhabditis spiculigera]